MKIFISGGAGFIGSHFLREVLKNPTVSNVVVYDNLSSGSISHIQSSLFDKRVALVEGDIKHLGLLTHSMDGADLVAHFAANPDISKAVGQPDIDFWEGTFLAQNILEAMRVNGVKRILYTSGSGVYGEAPEVAFSESYGPLFPISTYGASKLACEALISSYCHMFGMRGRAFRFANVVGPMQTHGVGYDFVRRLLDDGKVLRILGDGTQLKSYIYVSDVISAMNLVAQELTIDSTAKFDVFNVATDDYISVTEIAELACETVGLDPSAVIFNYTGGDRGWKGDVPKVLFDVSKIKGLGWGSSKSSRGAMKASLLEMFKECTK